MGEKAVCVGNELHIHRIFTLQVGEKSRNLYETGRKVGITYVLSSNYGVHVL